MAISLFNSDLNSLTKTKVQKLLSLGLDRYKKNEFLIASKYFKEIITLDNKNSDAYHYLGLVLYHFKDYDGALVNINISILKNKKNKLYYINLGNLYDEVNKLYEAISAYKSAIKLDYKYSEAYYNLGLVYQKLSEFEFSIENFSKAILYNNKMFEAYIGMGNSYQELGNFELSISCYDDAIKLNPNNFLSYFNKGVVYNKLFKYDEAIEEFKIAITLNNNIPDIHFNLAYSYYSKKDFNNAIIFYDNSILINKNYSHAYCNKGNVYKELYKFDDAIECYLKAIDIDSDYLEPYYNLGIVNFQKNDYNTSLHYYSILESKDENFRLLRGSNLHAKMHICYWDTFSSELTQILSYIEINYLVIEPFQFLSLSDLSETQHRVAEIWINDKYPFNPILGDIPKRVIKDKIRIGYYSADFREHPVSYLTAELYEQHDKSKFEIIAFYFGPDSEDLMQKRLRSSFDKFINVRQKSDIEIARLSREMEVDLAVDLTGITADCRIGIFSYRAAPIQISYIGYLGTTGAEYFDYLIADEIIIPAECQKFYAEKIIYLPCYQVNDSKRRISDKFFTRSELNIPENCFIYCCFNNNYKINPNIFTSWMRILTKVPDSVIVLYVSNSFARENLVKEALIRGVDASRLIFCEEIERSEYLARYKLMDLFLDTSPYNAGTTASDALWAGLPVLTCMGKSFASRVAASLLNAVGLKELITESQEDYERIAIELAQNKVQLLAIKDKLIHNKMTSILFDSLKFTKSLEEKYTTLVRG